MFAGPIGTVFLLFLSDVYGNNVGAAISQSLKVTDLVTFVAIRHLYSEMSDSLCDPAFQIWWLSESFRSALVGFDKTWRDHVFEQSAAKQIFIIWMFNMTYFFNDYLTLFWFATRSKCDVRVYSFGYVTGLILEYPKTLMKVRERAKRADPSSPNTRFARSLARSLLV